MSRGKQINGIFKAKRSLTQDDFLERASLIHGETYDYSESIYTGYCERIKILCKYHGFFEQIVSDHLNGRGCRKCYNERSKVWKTEDDLFLKENYGSSGFTTKRIAQHLNKTVNAIYGRVQFLNLSKKQTPITGQFPRHVWENTKNRAREKGFAINIDEDYLNELLIKQDFYCALSGVKLVSSRDNSTNTISIDRIDSSKGYIKGNVQIVHKDANLCKRNLNEIYFMKLSDQIAKHLRKRYSKVELEWDIMNDTERPIRFFSETPILEEDLHKNWDDEDLF